MESKTSLDIYDLNMKMIKKVSDSISIPLDHIINLSLEHGVFPEKCKISRTVPVFKAGQPTNLSNYRPISCLPVLSKIIEKVVAMQLFNYVDSNNILYNLQFGFQPGKSTVHPLIHLVDYISKAFNNSEYVIAVFLDFAKAFDTVNHTILLLKLSKIGVKGRSLEWFRSYLKNRKQFVMSNGILSDICTTFNISVLQGSILGPLLFLIFINDMHRSNNLLNTHFADDTLALCKGKNLYELTDLVNKELQKIGVWLRANFLSINASKTKIMIFHKNSAQIPDLSFFFNNNDPGVIENPHIIYPLERIHNLSKPCPAYKVLGIYIDENLSFDFHFRTLTNKISKSMYSLNKVKNVLPTSALKSIYYAIIHPHILYCLPITACTNSKNINSLYVKQKRCVRTISKSKYNAHSEPLFFSLKILPLPDLIIQQRLHFMHSIEYSYAPSSFYDLSTFPKNSTVENHVYPLRNLGLFNIPRIKNNFLKRFPFHSFTSTWNDLDTSLSSISSKILFKMKLKLYLLNKLDGFVCDKLFCYSCSINS